MDYRLKLDSGSLWFDPWDEKIPEIVQIGGHYDKKRKLWRLPLIRASIYGLRRLIGNQNIPWDPAVQAWFQYYHDGYVTDHWPDLYQFQRDGINFLLNARHGALLALSPGLGKTATALVAAELVPAERALIVAPLSLLTNWQAETRRWLHREASIDYQCPPSSAWCITNYDTVVRHTDWFTKDWWDVIILDESILLKNRKTARSKALEKLRNFTGRLWLLSGSPVSRYADDLYEQFHLIRPDAFTSYWNFAQRYCYTQSTPWTYQQVIGTRRNIDFRTEFEDLMFVRNQKDELPDLPELLHETIQVSLTPYQRGLYNSMQKQFIAELESGEILTAASKMAQLTRLQQIVSHSLNIDPGAPLDAGKLDALRDLLEAGEIDFPSIIWTHWRRTGETVAQMCRDLKLRTALVLGADLTARTGALNDFVADKLDVLVLSLGVGKYGLTLTNAKSMVYYDRSWDADAYKQSLARVHRIGLKWRPTVVTLHAPRTVDELVERNLRGKLRTISEISNDNLAALLRGLGGGSA